MGMCAGQRGGARLASQQPALTTTNEVSHSKNTFTSSRKALLPLKGLNVITSGTKSQTIAVQKRKFYSKEFKELGTGGPQLRS
jgi:hypothetical protein